MRRIAVMGAAGRMGKNLVEAVQQRAPWLTGLTAAIDAPWQHADWGGCRRAGLRWAVSVCRCPVIWNRVVDEFDVLIDFTLPDGHAEKTSRSAVSIGKAMVIGTTGLRR